MVLLQRMIIANPEAVELLDNNDLQVWCDHSDAHALRRHLQDALLPPSTHQD